MTANTAQVYRDNHGGWRWRIIAAENGLIIGAYQRREDAEANLTRVTGDLRPRDEGPDPQADEDES